MRHSIKKTFSVSTILFSWMIASWLLICASCSVKRYVPEGSMVVKKNVVVIDDSEIYSKTSVTPSELSDYISLPKNKSFLQMNLWAYNRKKSKFKQWMQKILNNPPSYFNYDKAEQSTNRIASYLNNRGYFNSEVMYSVKTKKTPKKAIVTYHIKLKKPYTINAIDYNIPDSNIRQIITKQYFEETIKVGQQYDFYALDEKRNAIANELRNHGFLFFNTDYVFYEIDSSFRDKSLKITLNIRPNQLLAKNQEYINHTLYSRKFYFDKIFVQPNYQSKLKNDTTSAITDTIVFMRPRYQNIKDSLPFFIIQTGKPKIRYKSIMPSIYLEPGDLYCDNNLKKTQSSISGLSSIGYCNISLDTVAQTSSSDSSHIGFINGSIDISKGTSQSYSVGVEATNNAGAFGTSLNLTYSHKNIFRGSEVLSLQLKLASEIQSNLGNAKNMNYGFWLFNTLEGGVQATLTFPRFLAPINQYRFPKYFRPKTNISLGYNFQIRPDYDRDIALASFGYFWKPEIKLSHKLTLLDLNVVKIDKTDDFEQKLNSYNNKRLYEQYSNHFIMALNYTFTYSTQEYGKAKNFIYLQASGESGGNLLYGINSLFNSPVTTIENISYYTIFGIRYAEYLKGHVEFRRYRYFGKYNHFVFRAFGGIGVPYGNAISLPFEKSFYSGGANDLRGWAINMVGPGGYVDNSKYERSGDIKLEANSEFRFTMSGFLKGAVFTDIGNVWLLHEEKDIPQGNFTFKDFYKQLYWDAGFGIRLDFSFFLIRADLAIPLYNPGTSLSTKWVIKKLHFNDLVLSFGIGYPF